MDDLRASRRRAKRLIEDGEREAPAPCELEIYGIADGESMRVREPERIARAP